MAGAGHARGRDAGATRTGGAGIKTSGGKAVPAKQNPTTYLVHGALSIRVARPFGGEHPRIQRGAVHVKKR